MWSATRRRPSSTRSASSSIARFKRPKDYVFVEALPKNNYGKILKTELRAIDGQRRAPLARRDAISARSQPCPIPPRPALRHARSAASRAAQQFRPFCSKRCADVDLNRWLSGVYAVPVTEEEDEDGDQGRGPARRRSRAEPSGCRRRTGVLLSFQFTDAARASSVPGENAMLDRRRFVAARCPRPRSLSRLAPCAALAQASLAEPLRPSGRAVPARRRHRRHRARGRRQAVRHLGPGDGDREQGRRRHQHRHRHGRQGRSRTATPCCCSRCRSRSTSFLFATLPYDPVADLAPVSLICDYPNVMCVPMSSPAQDGAGVHRPTPRPIPARSTYASSGYGTSVHLSGELFNRMAGVNLQHIPYRGAGPAFNDLIPGRVDVMFNNIGSVVPFIKGGKLRALGVTSLEARTRRCRMCRPCPRPACPAST